MYRFGLLLRKICGIPLGIPAGEETVEVEYWIPYMF